jgi:hypothetical protein
MGKNFAVLDIFLLDIYRDPPQGIVRLFNWLKCLGGIMHLKPTAGCQISTLIFEKILWRGNLYKYPMKNISRTAKFLPTLGLS